MADNPYIGLLNLGLSPEQAQSQIDEQRAMQIANLNPQARNNLNLYRGITGMARALGAKDPMLEQASQLRALASQFDTSTSKGLMEYAQALKQVNPAMAQQAMQMAMKRAEAESRMQETEAKTAKVREEAVREGAKNLREVRLREELAALPDEATDEQRMAVLSKYGDPDKVLKVLETKAQKTRELEAKKEAEKSRQEFQQQMQMQRIEAQKELRALASMQKGATTDLQRELLQTKIDALKEKASETASKKQGMIDLETSRAKNIIGILDNVTPKVGGLTSGLAGKLSSTVPGTEAYNIAKNIDTIKASLGFKELQDMRAASPTGGALGSIAVKELEFLQATLANLDMGQSKEQLTENLNKVRKHYSRWLSTVQGTLPAEDKETDKKVVRTGTVKAGPNAGKKVIEYADGTREYK